MQRAPRPLANFSNRLSCNSGELVSLFVDMIEFNRVDPGTITQAVHEAVKRVAKSKQATNEGRKNVFGEPVKPDPHSDICNINFGGICSCGADERELGLGLDVEA